MTKSAGETAVILTPQRVTIILNKPQVVPVSHVNDSIQIKRVTQCMGNHDRFGPRRNCLLQAIYSDVVREQINVQKDGGQLVLDDRIDRRRETGGHGNDFVTGPELAFAQAG